MPLFRSASSGSPGFQRGREGTTQANGSDLALFVLRMLRHQTKWSMPQRHARLVSILIVMTCGASDELHELSTPGRHARVTDVLIDGFGAAGFILGSALFRSFLPKKVERRKLP